MTRRRPTRGLERVFHTDRPFDPDTNPFGNQALRADGKAGWDGWPTSTRIEELRAAWLDAADMDKQRRICAELQKQVWEEVPFIQMGEYWRTTAYRKDVVDVLPGCFATFYGVRRTCVAPFVHGKRPDMSPVRAAAFFHSSGTCSMDRDPTPVVDRGYASEGYRGYTSPGLNRGG